MAARIMQQWNKGKEVWARVWPWAGAATIVVGSAYGYHWWSNRSSNDMLRNMFDPDMPYLKPSTKKVGTPTLVLATAPTIIGNVHDERAGKFFTFRRPGLDALISRLREKYEIVVYSTSDFPHSQELVARLDPTGNTIADFVSSDTEQFHDSEKARADALRRENKFTFLRDQLSNDPQRDQTISNIRAHLRDHTKQLDSLGRSMERVVLVDTTENLDFPYNTIVIPPWQCNRKDGCDPKDRELFNIIPMLEDLAAGTFDMRPAIKQAKEYAKSHSMPVGLAHLEVTKARR